MSEISKDKELINEGRKKPLEGVDAPLRDQVISKLVDKLESDDIKIGQRVRAMWDHGNMERTEWFERQKEYLSTWDEFLVSENAGPYKSASNLHVPMPLWVCKAFHARFLQTLSDFVVKARNPASCPREYLVKELLVYAITDWANYNKGIEEAKDRWVWDWVTTGVGWLKQRWDCTYTRFIDVQTVPEAGPPKFVVDPETGKETAQPTIKMVEKEVPVTKKMFEGPVLEWVSIEDVVAIGNQDPQLADAVIHSQFLTSSQLWTLVDRKIFREESVNEMIDKGPDRESAADPSGLKQRKAENAGRNRVDSIVEAEKYQVLEAHVRMDVDGSGIASDIIVWVSRTTGDVLGATYLHRVNKSGERPFFKIEFHQHGDTHNPMGLVEMLYPLSKEIDAHHNMRIDFGFLSVMPFGFYRPTSNVEAEQIELSPGVMIPVDNPQSDVYFPQLGNRTAFGSQEEAALMNMVERLTGISDLSLGVIGGQGATRTATGARALVSESSANLDVYLGRLNRGWKRVLKYLFDQLQQRLPKGLEFRTIGTDGQQYFKVEKGPEEIAGDFDFEVSASSASSNKQIQIETAKEVLSLTSNPLDIQLQIVTASNRYEAIKNYLQVLGVKDFSRFINAKFESMAPQLTPEEEAGRVLNGMNVPVTPDQDHDGFLAYYQEHYNDDNLFGQYTEEQAKAFHLQAMKHQQMKQALQQMAAQQANANQMRMNASMSQNQTPMAPVAGTPPGPQQGAA